MPANVECPCGHTVRVPDELLNTRVKCPVCGELLSTAAARPDDDPSQKLEHTPVESSQGVSGSTDTSAQSTEAESGEANYPDLTSSGKARSVSSLHAKGGFLFAGLPTPSFLAESRLTLLPERVQIKSSGLLGTRRLDLLRLSEITSAETRRGPAWYLLILGIPLLLAKGFGLILLLAFLFVRHSYLILRCGNATVAVRFKGDDTDACAIGDAILQAAQTATGKLREPAQD